MNLPRRSPLACGALGAYDRERVLAMADEIGSDLRVVHEDARSILLLDRPPISWRGASRRGLAWIDAGLWRGGPIGDWSEAARAGACGLGFDGSGRFLHSSINGIAPLYWIDARRATYFASKIEPLARTSPTLLSIDWDAWASIIVMRYPQGRGTPFAEISRVPQFSTLRRRFGSARLREERWPWAELEPVADISTAAADVVDALRGSLAPIAEPVVCPLSGGRDSRILFLALAEQGRVARAVTVADDAGDSFEEDLAAPVAAALGVPHRRIAPWKERYAADWDERARRVEYQFVDHPWLLPLASHVAGSAGPIPDGFAIDTWFASGGHFFTPELVAGDGIDVGSALFDTMRRYGRAHLALTEPFRAPLQQSARKQITTTAARFEGHRNQALLAFYVARSLRGVATYPTGLLGASARVFAPGGCDEVATAALGADPRKKLGGSLYGEVLGALHPRAGSLPSTADVPRRPPHLARRWRSAAAIEMYRELVHDGPLATHVSPELSAWLENPDGAELSGDLRLGMEGVALLHAWLRHYEGQLHPVDAADLLG